MVIRRVGRAESSQVCALIAAITEEVYDLPYAEEDWTPGWIAVDAGAIVGMTKTFDDRVEDLWVIRGRRDAGLGARLLSHAEEEIAARGHRTARLRVVAANDRARVFYQRHGWRESHALHHEQLRIEMIEMTKQLS